MPAPARISVVSELTGLRDDVYRRPLATALERLGLGPGLALPRRPEPGWRRVGCSGRNGRARSCLCLDSDPQSATRWPHGRAIPRSSPSPKGEDLILPEQWTWPSAGSWLLHAIRPAWWCGRMAAVGGPEGGVAKADQLRPPHRRDAASMPDARHPDIGAVLPRSPRCWAGGH